MGWSAIQVGEQVTPVLRPFVPAPEKEAVSFSGTRGPRQQRG